MVVVVVVVIIIEVVVAKDKDNGAQYVSQNIGLYVYFDV